MLEDNFWRSNLYVQLAFAQQIKSCKRLSYHCSKQLGIERSRWGMTQKSQKNVSLIEKERDDHGEDLHETRLLQASTLASSFIWFPPRINEPSWSPLFGTILIEFVKCKTGNKSIIFLDQLCLLNILLLFMVIKMSDGLCFAILCLKKR